MNSAEAIFSPNIVLADPSFESARQLLDQAAARTDLLEVGDGLVELPAKFGPFGELILGACAGELGFVFEDLAPEEALLMGGGAEIDARVGEEELSDQHGVSDHRHSSRDVGE